MSEQTNNALPSRIDTDRDELELVHMTTHEGDRAYFELQKSNEDYWKEFGNTIYGSITDVTDARLEHGDGRFGIMHEGKLVGIVSRSIKDHPNEAEVGVLLDEKASGHGYATAAVLALTKTIAPQFERIYAEVSPENTRSIKLLKNAGYQSKGEPIKRDWGAALVFEVPK